MDTGQPRQGARRGAIWVVAGALAVVAAACSGGETQQQSAETARAGAPVEAVGGQAAATRGHIGSESCRDCHESFYQLWAPSHHGTAMQPFTAELGRSKLRPLNEPMRAGGGEYRVAIDDAGGRLIELDENGATSYPMRYALGGKNVFYFLTPLERGRLQVLPLAFDVNEGEWFDTAASAMRHFTDAEDEALSWLHPAYTFNTSCFGCHVSQLSTNYDVPNDTYQTAWAEPGINCETCHGGAEEHVRVCREAEGGNSPEDLKIIRTSAFDEQQSNDLCASCHSKGMPLSTDFQPGDRYYDHFDLVTLEHSDYYVDGRDLGENYTQTSWLLSPCVRGGELDCMHCHTSSGRFRQKQDPNRACAPCHVDYVADPEPHTHHPEAGPGGRCIDCHMPSTWFARMERHDHSMRPPTPRVTMAFDSPNACNNCHADKNAAWADGWVRQWRDPEYQQPYLEQAALIDAARRGNWSRMDEMSAYLQRDDRNDVFATALVRLLRGAEDQAKWTTLLAAARDRSPLVRASAVEALGDRLTTESVTALVAATRDEYRLVRIRAAAALAQLPPRGLREEWRPSVESATAELLDSLHARPDDAYSHYNLGNYELNRGNVAAAASSFETAHRLRPDLVEPLVNLAMAQARAGRIREAEQSLRRALELEPESAAALFNLGLLLGEAGRLDEAAAAHRKALEADPELAAAAYNLAVILSGKEPAEALRWSRKAAELRPDEPKYAYTLAFYLHEQGDTDAAIVVLERLIATHPGYAEGWGALGSTYEQQGRIEDARALYRRAADNEALPMPIRRRFAALAP